MEQKKAYKNILMILAMLVFLFSWCSVVHAEENVLLKDMPIEELGGSLDGEWEKEIKDPNGNYYSENILEIDTLEGGYVAYDLDGQYTRFSGKIVIDELVVIDGESYSPFTEIGIYGDGRELYSWGSQTEQAEAWYFDIDVAGVGKLEILSGGITMFSLENGMFKKAEERAVPPVYTPLRELAVIDSSVFNFYQFVYVTEDINGKVHRGIQSFDTYGETDSEAYALYNLNMKYTSFSCKLDCFSYDDNGSNIKAEIYLDDQLAFERSMTGEGYELVDVNLDVTNAKTMKIRLVGRDCTLDVLDDSLSPHTLGEWETETEATCNKAGKKVQRCTGCKAICNTAELKALEHTPGDWKIETEATCNAEGERKKYCTVCKKVCEEEKIPKLEHKEEDGWFEQEAPTCTSEGTRIKRCIYCGETVKTKKIPQTKHEFGKWITAEGSVWNAPIVKKRTCNACDAEEVKNIYTWVWGKPAVLVLLFVSVLTGTTIILIRRKGIQTISKNQRKFWRKKKKEKRTQQDDVFHGHQ